MIGSVLRRQKDHSHTPIPCPESIILYNKYMGGVDWGDQLRGYYNCRTKSRKFYKYIFHFLFDEAITNSYVLQKSFCSNIKNIKDYWLKLAIQLIGQYCSRQRAGHRPVAIRTLPFPHFPVRIPSDSEVVKHKRGRCAYCKETSHTRNSYWFCRECEVWLCHSSYSDDCFLLLRTRQLSGELRLPSYIHYIFMACNNHFCHTFRV